jgi:outer membrane receptor for ferrienterochelin and colicins
MVTSLVRTAACCVAAMAVLIRPVHAQQPLPDLSLEELMRLDAGQVYGASERLQPVTEAPASVSFITAEEIARFGYRTLAEILHGVRGMYVSDDRNFSLIGTRGFGKPGDYNSRILLLVNGHRVNDNVFGQAEVGAEFGMDAAMFERVEIIRGPASALYGDSAFFAVVNVITKTGASLDGVSLTTEVGTLGRRMARVSGGVELDGGVDLALAATVEGSDGVDELYFSEFDAPETNHGIAQGLDGEGIRQFYGRLAVGDFTLTTAYGTRRKDVPTASFGTLFNEQLFRERTTDRHTLVDAEYVRTLAGTRVAFRGSFDRFTYDGIYPFAGETEDRPLVGHNSVDGMRWTGGVRLVRRLPWQQTLTAGVEVIDNVRQNQHSQYLDPQVTLLDSKMSSLQQAFYVQDEVRWRNRLVVNAGLRYDRYEGFTRATPRAAVIVMPSTMQSFKYLFGNAFRAPNAYERNTVYFGGRVDELRPESIDTHEVVWERYTNDWLRTSVSGYWYRADQLIAVALDPDALLGVTYVNQGRVRARGVEVEAQMRLKWNWQAFASYAVQRAVDDDTREELPNSPRHMAKARLSIPLRTPGAYLSVEGLAFSDRGTVSGARVPGVGLLNVSLIQPIGRAFEMFVTVRNAFDAQYWDPASDQHRQDAIPRDGRTARIGLRWRLWAR